MLEGKRTRFSRTNVYNINIVVQIMKIVVEMNFIFLIYGFTFQINRAGHTSGYIDQMDRPGDPE